MLARKSAQGPALSGPVMHFFPYLVIIRTFSMFDDHTTAAIDTARRRIQDISNFQIHRLRTCESSLADQQQLSAELREDMDNISRLVEELAVAIEDQQGEKARKELEKAVNEIRDTLSQYVLLLLSLLVLMGPQVQAEKRHSRCFAGF